MPEESTAWKRRLTTLQRQLQCDRPTLPEFRLLTIEWPHNERDAVRFLRGAAIDFDRRKIVASARKGRFRPWVSDCMLIPIREELDVKQNCYDFARFKSVAEEIGQLLPSIESSVPEETLRIVPSISRFLFALDDLLKPKRHLWNGNEWRSTPAVRCEPVPQYAWLTDVVFKTVQAIDMLTEGGDPPPLTENEKRVLSIIQEQPRGDGILGKQIIDQLTTQALPIDQSTLTRHIIPMLKRWYGVDNRRGVGYYIAES